MIPQPFSNHVLFIPNASVVQISFWKVGIKSVDFDQAGCKTEGLLMGLTRPPPVDKNGHISSQGEALEACIAASDNRWGVWFYLHPA